ncbi:MAG: MBL fold metallo-hydrolase, partial [Phycisphaerae bacterium]|nr:MBL fold metallo-hydrolase [Phycisphaerae bacterium]
MTTGTQPPPQRLDLGDRTVTLLSGGSLKLDGGAMFGIIPKALWARTTPADDLNRIQLHCNCLLVEYRGESARRIIIETGHGPKYAEKEQKIFAIDPQDWLLPTLQSAGVDPGTITDVAVTHLHFDHAGGLTHEQDGRLMLTFPRARVHVQRREYDDARAGFGVMTATYRQENLLPIDEAGVWQLHDGEAEIAPGVHVSPLPGHTRGHQAIMIRGSDRTMVFSGDAMPTAQ